MKKKICFILILACMLALSGCAKGVESCPEEDNTPRAGTSDNLISSDMLSQGMYDALQKEWSAWNAKTKEQQLISSHMPGHCYKQFNDWKACEAFLGFDLFNPLENSDWPEKASYVGMPVGYNDAPRFYVSFYGSKEGEVEWIYVDSGYRDGDVRITVNAHIYPDAPQKDIGEQMITEDSGERYVATSKTVVLGPVVYNIRVIGEANQWKEVRETLAKVLPYFEDKNLEEE